MASIDCFVYGWSHKPYLKQSISVSDSSRSSAPLLALGAEDCGIITGSSSESEELAYYCRQFKAAGLVECCFESYRDVSSNNDTVNENSNEIDTFKRDSIVLLSSSKNIIIYNDSNSCLWSFGLDVIEKALLNREEISKKSSAEQEGVNSTLTPIAILPAIKVVEAVVAKDTVAENAVVVPSTKLGSCTLINAKNNGNHKDESKDDIIFISVDKSLNTYGNIKHACLSSRISIKQIAAGDTHCLVLTNDSKLYTLGTGKNGELGIGARIGFTKTLQKVVNFNKKHFQGNGIDKLEIVDEDIKYIAAGSHYSAVISATGSLYTFGCGAYYRLGHGSDDDCLFPTRVEALQVLLVDSTNV
jgi:hypothetical protein